MKKKENVCVCVWSGGRGGVESLDRGRERRKKKKSEEEGAARRRTAAATAAAGSLKGAGRQAAMGTATATEVDGACGSSSFGFFVWL